MDIAIHIPVDQDVFFFTLDPLVFRNPGSRNTGDAGNAFVGGGDTRLGIDLGIESIACRTDQVAFPGYDFDYCLEIVGHFHILHLRRCDAAVFDLDVTGCRS